MTESKAYKVIEYQELLAMREAVEDTEKATTEPESATVASYPDAKPTSIPEVEAPPEAPPVDPVNHVNGDKMPKSLHGMTAGAIQLAAIDGNLTGPEQDWFQRRRWKLEEARRRNRTPGPNDWMGY